MAKSNNLSNLSNLSNLNNYNQQDKFIKINGEYVKLYVTTNSTLPKLLKNTGSLIVYHQSSDLNSIKNSLYLGNELIAGGYGFVDDDKRKHAEEILPAFDPLYEFITGKNFWEDATGAINNITGISDLKSAIASDTYVTNFLGWSLPKIINEGLNGITDKITGEINKFLEKHSDLSDISITPYLTQKSPYDTKESVKIWMDELPYMLSPATYLKPEIKSKEFKVYYSYYDSQTNNYIHENNEQIIYEAEYVDGKFEVPRGAFITRISIIYNIAVNDAERINYINGDYYITGIHNISDLSVAKLNTNISSLVPTSSEFPSLFVNKIGLPVNSTHITMTKQSFSGLSLSSVDADQGLITVMLSNATYPFVSQDDNYSLVFDDFTLCDNITLAYTGVPTTKLKEYPYLTKAYDNGFLSNENEEEISRDTKISYENAFGDGQLETGDSIQIHAVDSAICMTMNTTLQYFENLSTGIDDIFQDYKNISIIKDGKVTFEKSVKMTSDNICMIFVAVPFDYKISSIYVSIFDNIEKLYKEIDISGLTFEFTNIKYYNTLCPLNYSFDKYSLNDTYYKKTDESNIFSYPFKIYVAVMNDETISSDLENDTLANVKISLEKSTEKYDETIVEINYDADQNNFFLEDMIKNYINNYNTSIDQSKYWSTHIFNYNSAFLYISKILPTDNELTDNDESTINTFSDFLNARLDYLNRLR